MVYHGRIKTLGNKWWNDLSFFSTQHESKSKRRLGAFIFPSFQTTIGNSLSSFLMFARSDLWPCHSLPITTFSFSLHTQGFKERNEWGGKENQTITPHPLSLSIYPVVFRLSPPPYIFLLVPKNARTFFAFILWPSTNQEPRFRFVSWIVFFFFL